MKRSLKKAVFTWIEVGLTFLIALQVSGYWPWWRYILFLINIIVLTITTYIEGLVDGSTEDEE